MSEKYDGIRALWTGSKMILRTGRQLELPNSFQSGLASITLDGEIWTQRGLHQQAVSLVKSTSNDNWDNAKFLVFDVPETCIPFEERMEKLRSFSFPAHIVPIEMVKCKGSFFLAESPTFRKE